METKIEKLANGDYECKVVIDANTFEQYKPRAFKKIQAVAEIEGWRKGHANEEAIVKKYGQGVFLEEMAEIAIKDSYSKVLNETKAIPVSEPHIVITKLAMGNPFEITITFTPIPEVTLPDVKKIYSKAKSEIKEEDVTDEDVTEVLSELQKNKAHEHHHEANPDDHNHDHGELALQPIDDEFARSFGPHFKDLNDLKTAIKENMSLEKAHKIEEKRRALGLEKIVEETKVNLPEIMIKDEQTRMFGQMKHDITKFGGSFEDYLKETGKTEQEVLDGLKDNAKKRVLNQLVIGEIARKENLFPSETDIEAELVRLRMQYADVDDESGKAYLRQSITTEKVFEYLNG